MTDDFLEVTPYLERIQHIKDRISLSAIETLMLHFEITLIAFMHDSIKVEGGIPTEAELEELQNQPMGCLAVTMAKAMMNSNSTVDEALSGYDKKLRKLEEKAGLLRQEEE